MTDAPETVGDLDDDVTVRYWKEKRVVHLDDVDCRTQEMGPRGAGVTKEAGVLFDDRRICEDCRELCGEGQTATLGQEGAE
jgi:hypothetical protein